jgi:hypothetical protein
VRRFLACGVLAHGFVRVRCRGCGEESLVAFSCKGRLCPSCGARRAHVTAAHLVEEVLPYAPWRQWTLSFPYWLRWKLVKDETLLAEVLRLLVGLVSARHRREARRLGVEGTLRTGAVTFVQYFGSALQLSPHFHSLVADAVVVVRDDGLELVPVPPPSPEEVEQLALQLVQRVKKLLEKRGLLEADAFPEDALEALRLASLQQRLPHIDDSEAPRARRHPRLAVVDGFSLHADTAVHAHDRAGLERLCRYGSRGAVAVERLSRRPDGMLEYHLKKPGRGGATSLVLTPLAFLKRLAAVVPPRGKHLVRFHGCFAPNARLRAAVVTLGRPAPAPPPPAPEPTPGPAPARASSRPRLDWASLLRRTFGFDVLTCPRCGDQRTVLGVVIKREAVDAVLTHLGLPTRRRPPARDSPRPPQLPLPL